MTDDEIRARALDAAVRLVGKGVCRTTNDVRVANRAVLEMADLLATYIRLGMEAVEGMLRPPVA